MGNSPSLIAVHYVEAREERTRLHAATNAHAPDFADTQELATRKFPPDEPFHVYSPIRDVCLFVYSHASHVLAFVAYVIMSRLFLPK